MTSTTIKTIMTLVAVIAGAAMLVPQLKDYQAALSALAVGLAAWAHGKRPGDMENSGISDESAKKDEEVK